MNVLHCDQIKHKDTMAMLGYGIPGVLLMEHAALKVLEEMERRRLLSGNILVICGTGNNGGDGYALARLLHQKGATVTVLNVFDTPPKTADALSFFHMVQKMEISFGTVGDIENADVIVDAIFGIGMKRELNEFCCEIINKINESKAVKVCIDLPSGMDGDETFQKNPVVCAHITVTFTAYKSALLFYPSALSAGEVVLADIGIPKGLGDDKTCVIEKKWVKQQLPKRDVAGHKNSFGSLLVAGGSTGMTGAPVLCSQAALVCGCGLVTAAVPKSLHSVFEEKLTEVMTLPLEDRHRGCFDQEGRDAFLERAKSVDAVVFGPGAGRESGTESLLHGLLQTDKKIVIDADGLNVLANRMDWLANKSNAACIVTPHPGEMSRLAGVPVSEIEKDRVEFARNFAQKYNVVLVLKGARTVVAAPDGKVFVNLFGNCGMATAGSGDVLAGIIGSFLAQGASDVQSAVCGVALHGLAGDSLKEKIGEYGMTAGDLWKQIPFTIKEILEVE